MLSAKRFPFRGQLNLRPSFQRGATVEERPFQGRDKITVFLSTPTACPAPYRFREFSLRRLPVFRHAGALLAHHSQRQWNGRQASHQGESQSRRFALIVVQAR
jgi:hypothetical protein